MSTQDDMARQVDAAAVSVDGVARLYSVAPVVVGIVRAIAPAVAPALASAEDQPLSSVSGDEQMRVLVSIGVRAPHASADVAERVSAAVREITGPASAIHVRVSRIHHGADADA